MADERIRVEIGFDGGQGVTALVPTAAVDDLERRLAGGEDGTFGLDAEDGRYLLMLRRVVFVKRFAREPRLGFGSP